MARKRILFAGYAKVHFVCFLPVYRELAKQPDVELFLSGGHRTVDGVVLEVGEQQVVAG